MIKMGVSGASDGLASPDRGQRRQKEEGDKEKEVAHEEEMASAKEAGESEAQTQKRNTTLDVRDFWCKSEPVGVNGAPVQRGTFR